LLDTTTYKFRNNGRRTPEPKWRFLQPTLEMANFEDGAYPTRSYREWLGAWRYGAAANWANGTLDWKADADFDRWHFLFVCGMCKRGDICGVPLQRCNGCRIVYYCSKAHQKKAWPLHKQICGQMRSLLSGANENTVHNAAEWKQYLFNGFGALRGLADDPSILDRAMICDEWHFQRHCQVCFYNPAAENATTRTLTPCSLCYCAAYCSNPACMMVFRVLHTVEACENYMNGFASIVMSMQQGTHLIICCNTRATTFSLPRSWKDYFNRKITDFPLPSLIIELPPVMVSRRVWSLLCRLQSLCAYLIPLLRRGC
jgi:hypothetical protein